MACMIFHVSMVRLHKSGHGLNFMQNEPPFTKSCIHPIAIPTYRVLQLYDTCVTDSERMQVHACTWIQIA